MSIPLDNLYNYIETICRDYYRKRVIIYRFYPHGSKKLENLTQLSFIPNSYEWSMSPSVYCNDQEPLNFDYYQDQQPKTDELSMFLYQNNIVTYDNNFRGAIDTMWDYALLLHSEKNSAEIEKYESKNFVPVYYWSHAIIARDWFRYAEHIDVQQKSIDKMFLIYNRAWLGTREYRLKFTDYLIDFELLRLCKTACNPIDSSVHYRDHEFKNISWQPNHDLESTVDPTNAISEYSATFDVADYASSLIEVVLETLFDDSRIHLTEKIFRPIALGKPFILASTAKSLEYLQGYGFKTFSTVFDESYDSIIDPHERMIAIIKLMKDISNWDPAKLESAIKECNEIAQYNRMYFFSDRFFNLVTTELKSNLHQGIDKLLLINTSHSYNKKREFILNNETAFKLASKMQVWDNYKKWNESK